MYTEHSVSELMQTFDSTCKVEQKEQNNFSYDNLARKSINGMLWFGNTAHIKCFEHFSENRFVKHNYYL